MTQRILLVVTSAERMGTSTEQTGYWLEEVTVPYYVLTDAGYTVDIASPKGGTPPRDVESNKPEHRGDASARFEQDITAMEKLNSTRLLAETPEADYAAVFFAGGHGAMADFPLEDAAIRTVENFYAAGKPVASVCHGPACLVGAKAPDGAPIIAGKRFTCFTDEEETAAGAEKAVPFLLQTTLEAQGGIFNGGAAFGDCSVADGLLITGQNPASGASSAQLVINLLEAQTKNSAKA